MPVFFNKGTWKFTENSYKQTKVEWSLMTKYQKMKIEFKETRLMKNHCSINNYTKEKLDFILDLIFLV